MRKRLERQLLIFLRLGVVLRQVCKRVENSGKPRPRLRAAFLVFVLAQHGRVHVLGLLELLGARLGVGFRLDHRADMVCQIARGLRV
jgi:hypothetical protein